MRLHKILMRHAGPKSQVEFTLLYALANSEEQILERLDEAGGKYTYGAWTEREEFIEGEHDEDERGPDGKRLLEIRDDDHKVIGRETYRQRMLRLRGEFNDGDANFDDAYYGIKHYGWGEGADVTEADIEALRRVGVPVEDWREQSC
jgi:hypothetical protein